MLNNKRKREEEEEEEEEFAEEDGHKRIKLADDLRELATLKNIYRENKNEYINKMFDSFKKRITTKNIETRKKEKLQEIYLSYIDDVEDGIADKHAIVRDMRECLALWDQGKTSRSPNQIESHENLLATSACCIYGVKYFTDEYMTEILEVNNWTRDDVFPLYSSTQPRRFGKTWTIAMYTDVLLNCVPNIEISIFAPTFGQSSKLLAFVKAKLALKFTGWKIIRSTPKEFWITKDGVDIRKVYAWPKGTKVR